MTGLGKLKYQGKGWICVVFLEFREGCERGVYHGRRSGIDGVGREGCILREKTMIEKTIDYLKNSEQHACS